MWIWDSGWKKVGSGMRDKHPGSANTDCKDYKTPGSIARVDNTMVLFPEREDMSVNSAGFSCGCAGYEDPVGGLVQELPRIVQLPLLPPKNLEKN
jgi:hypothetical protein